MLFAGIRAKANLLYVGMKKERWEDEEIFDCFDVRSCSILLRSDDGICRSGCSGSTGVE